MVYPGGKDRKQVPIVDDNRDSILSNNLPGTSSKDDVVTLTKSQLRAILEAIGQVGPVNNNDKSPGNEQDGNNPTCCGNQVLDTNSRYASLLSTSNSQELNCPVSSLLPDASKEWSSSSQKPQLLSPTKLSPYSKFDQKRMQWERERAEVLDWNPWGKPGAGAPTRRTLPVASVAPRTENQLLTVQTNPVPYSSSMPNGIPSCHTSPSHFRSGITIIDHPDISPNKPFANHNCINQLVKPVPPVFKSSINFGTTDDDSLCNDALKKQQWLKDLEKQREEQRLRQMAESEHYNHGQEAEWANGNMEDMESISVSVDGCAMPIIMDGRTHVRGQGFKLDPVSAARADERRQKAQECQQAIRLQMEEKQQRLLLEKEKKKREEEEEERRLVAERARLQAEYEQEQHRIKQKKEVEEHKQTVVMSAVRKAEAEAEADKRKKSHKLQTTTTSEVGSDVGSPKKSSIEVASPRIQPKGAKQNSERRESEVSAVRSSQQMATVRPIQNTANVNGTAKTEESPLKELGIQTAPLSSQEAADSCGYVVNRVLTPSLFRMKLRGGCAKDFGTQTDVNYGRWIGDDPETTDHSNTSSVCAPVGKRLNRIQHSKPYKASRRQLDGDIDSAIDRPKWGANQPSKSYIRMTDRDPHFTKRKKLQDLRKQHWEREMASQQALRIARRSNVGCQNQSKSYPNLRIRGRRSSSDGTAGFSSSEFETSHVQSNSPPRHRQNYSFRSVCGSAEDITYYGPSSTYSSTLLPSMPRRRGSQSSDNLPSIIGGSEPAPSRFTERFSFPEVSSASGTGIQMRRKWHSQEAFCPQPPDRRSSPPVPALRRQQVLDDGCLSSRMTHSRRKWSDQESFDLESVALSHAKSRPATSDDGSDQIERDSLSSADSSKKPKTPVGHNPLVCPEVITGRPTPRQDRILHNLSSLRKGLLQKQKELETLIRHPPHKS